MEFERPNVRAVVMVGVKMMKTALCLKSNRSGATLIRALGCAVLGFSPQVSSGFGSAPSYAMAELNYVDLPDRATAGAHPIQTRKMTPRPAESIAAPVVVELHQLIQPHLAGIGGAYMILPAADRQSEAEALFNPKTGAGLTFCRTAVGASDFGLSAYSYSETPDDYQMTHFSVERDARSIIPFIRAAQSQNSGFRLFASSWSPPAWMKGSEKMDDGSRGDPTDVLKADPAIYKAYALYFSKYEQAYAKHGVRIDRLVVQNETDMSPKYPVCNMVPEQMAELVSNYIRPQFTRDALNTEIWAGSFRDVQNQEGARPDAQNFMKLPGATDVDGVGLQYCPPTTVQELRAGYPDLMHTEGTCCNGKNTFGQARECFKEAAGRLNSGSENYCYWNIVLNETSRSGWAWRQNSLMKIDLSGLKWTGDLPA